MGALEAARTALAGAGDAGATHDALLLAAAVGVPGAVPLGDDADVTAQCASVLQELDRRRAAAAAAKDGAARIAAVLGPDWRVLGRVTPADPAELAVAFGASDELQAGDPHAAATWLTRAAHVREGAGRLDGALMYAEALGSPERLALHVAQLPHRPGDRWAALPSTPDHPIEGGRLSLVAQAAGAPIAEGKPICGLVIDEWTEVVPEATQVTGVGFHFDQPNARAAAGDPARGAARAGGRVEPGRARGGGARDARPRADAAGRPGGAGARRTAPATYRAPGTTCRRPCWPRARPRRP